MEKADVIYRVPHSDWATPLVTVLKDDKSVRLCGDYLVTVNSHLKIDHYPLPLPEHIFATLAGSTVFTVLDLPKAYLQLELDENSQEILTVNTHLGLFRFKRLPYCVASEPTLFKSVMNQILKGIPGTVSYIDDVLISGKTKKNAQKTLNVF